MADENLSAPPGRAQQIQIVNSQGLGLSAQFFWVQDRFQHNVTVLDVTSDQDATEFPLLASESRPFAGGPAGSEHWPADPPLQQLSVEPIGERDAVLAVGQAGCGHWSSSVEAFLQEDAATLKFDIACRFSRPAEYLGSQYRLLVPDHPARSEGNDVMLARHSHSVRLSACAPAASGARPLAWQVAEGGQRLWLSVPNGADRLPRTVRWQFTVALG